MSQKAVGEANNAAEARRGRYQVLHGRGCHLAWETCQGRPSPAGILKYTCEAIPNSAEHPCSRHLRQAPPLGPRRRSTSMPTLQALAVPR